MDASEAVGLANDAFYRALSLADLGAMRRVWLHTDTAVCTHPNGPPLHGWDAIQDSWQRIFEGKGPLRVWATEVRVRLFGLTAEVTCVENIDTGRGGGPGLAQARATNIFRLDGGRWRLLEHHAAQVRTSPQQRPARFSVN